MRCGETAHPSVESWTAMSYVSYREHPRGVGGDRISVGDYRLRNDA
jgi:hypothetical protein